MAQKEDAVFMEAVAGLKRGDFTLLEPLFVVDFNSPEGKRGRCKMVAWCEAGRFAHEPAALAEAFTCACWHGYTAVAEQLRQGGADVTAGMGTGMNAFHWAANRGQLETVKYLIALGLPMETRNMYGGTVLGCTVWSAVHEPKKDHLAIIEALIDAGAKLSEAALPSGDARVDELLRRRGR